MKYSGDYINFKRNIIILERLTVRALPTALPQQVTVHFGSDQWLPAWQQGSVMSLPVHGSVVTSQGTHHTCS